MAKKKSKAKKVMGKKGKKSAPRKVKKKMARPVKRKAARKPGARKRAPRPRPVMESSTGPEVITSESLTVVVESPSDLGQLNDLGGTDMTSPT